VALLLDAGDEHRAQRLWNATQQASSVPSPRIAASGEGCPENVLPLPGEAVARAADQARIEAPALYEGIDARGVTVTAAYRATYGLRGAQVELECGAVTARRTVVVELFFPRMLPSASLSQGTVFVSRFPHGYRVWEVAH
jgi:hypothetical protein